MSLVIGNSGDDQIIEFAAANMVGTSNEDRHCTAVDHLKILNNRSGGRVEGDFSSFGVFDGHNGVSNYRKRLPLALPVNHPINPLILSTTSL